MLIRKYFAPAAAALLAVGFVSAAAAATPAIALEKEDADSWSATYRLDEPARKLVFLRNPDDSRIRGWRPERGFEIVRIAGADQLRRKDRRPFRKAAVEMPSSFSAPPKDYAPFLPFSDGALLIHSGRFFACSDICPVGSEWRMSIETPERERTILDGTAQSGPVAWIDAHDGRKIYVGAAAPVEASHFIGIIDPGLPGNIRDELGRVLPGFMDYFAHRLGPLERKPMLFVSYQPGLSKGISMKGGTLPTQSFMEVPAVWANAGKAAQEIPWFFAHEAAHLFQGNVTPEEEQAWIHEGSADAFAARALAATSTTGAAFAAARIKAAQTDCKRGLGEMRLNRAAQNGFFALYYSCGLVIHERLDAAIRQARPGSDGAFALWRDYRDRVRSGAPAVAATFMKSVAAVAGPDLALWTQRIANEKLKDPAVALYARESAISGAARRP